METNIPRSTFYKKAHGRRTRRIIRLSITYILLFIGLVYALAPFLWIVSCSLRPSDELFTKEVHLLPQHWTIQYYIAVLHQQSFWEPLLNTLYVGGITCILATLIAALSAYSLARYRFRGRRVFTTALLVTQMLPGVLLLLPLFLLFNQIGLYNTRQGLVIGFTTFAVPFSILVMRSYFHDLPVELEEQAMVDGATRLGAFFLITLPLALPVIVATMLNVFVLVWNDIVFTLMLTSQTRTRTIGVALHLLEGAATHLSGPAGYSSILAEGVLMCFPVVFLFMFLQKYVIEGMTAGALKA